MISSKTKAVVMVFALLLVVGLVAVGCKPKPKKTWVNTNSMPGHTFNRNYNQKPANSSTIVYLGSDSDNANPNFGPQDVSFEFHALR